MGTTYNVKHDLKSKDLKAAVDSILIEINNSVSTYIPKSIISQINQDSLGSPSTILVNGQNQDYLKYQFERDKHFLTNFEKSFKVFQETDSFFDPTIMPLVNYWGFGYHEKVAIKEVDSLKVNAIANSIGLEKWTINLDREKFRLIKPIKGELDFSAIAKGYAVDEISRFLEEKGAKNYMVEIGGEVFTKGLNDKNQLWTVGLNTPKHDAGIYDFISFVQVDSKGVASSGNYRIFHEVDGKKYGHEINPKSGYPELNRLQGVTVIANTCMEADAFATAFMVMGLERSKAKIKSLENIDACFFYFDDEGNIVQEFSLGFEIYLKN